MPSKNPSKRHLLVENLLRTLLRSVQLHDPLGVHPIGDSFGGLFERGQFRLLRLAGGIATFVVVEHVLIRLVADVW